jgi:outer membrane protein assembly factor BamB
MKLFLIPLLLVSMVVVGQTETSWHNYRGNNILNGYSPSSFKPPIRLAWRYKTGDEIKSSPVIAGNMIFIGSMDGYLYAINTSGKLQWRYKTEASIEAPPLFVRNTVVVGSMDGTVYALEASTGKLKWKFKTEGQIAGGANWMTDGTGIQILVPSYDYNLYSLDFETGKMRWKTETNNYLNGTAATDNRRITIGGCDSYLHVIDSSNGISLGKIDIGTYVAESSAISGNLAFVGDYDGGFTCVNLNTYRRQWKFENPRMTPFLSSPAISGEKVVIGSHDRRVYCFNKSDGKILWTYTTFGKIDSSPVIIRNMVLIGSNDGILHFINLTNGKKISTYEIGVAMKSTPAIVDQLMVVGGKDGYLYAFTGAN